ncbi:hypothetical protein Taro_007230 [Colocasia esculenta]|uniref:Uncharacterized protein n=1 Tax=Colocasia esculenta TaxID=4460 RepID=A0A843TQR8_COLES|nr:hypothetical protein [Colocasia esculenta]
MWHVEGSPTLEDAMGDAKNRQPRSKEDVRGQKDEGRWQQLQEEIFTVTDSPRDLVLNWENEGSSYI